MSNTAAVSTSASTPVRDEAGAEARALTRLPARYGWSLFTTFCFALANGISHGRWQPVACVILIAVLGVLGWRFYEGRSGPADLDASAWSTSKLTKLAVVFLVALPIVGLVDPTVLAQPVRSMTMIRVVQGLSIALIASYVPFLDGARRESETVKTARFYGFALLLLAGGISVIYITPHPGIDVWTIQQRGADCLLAGKNPYVCADVPDTDPENDFTVPYVYPPAAIYMGTIGRVLTGDVRYMLVLAMMVAGVVVRSITKRTLGSSQGAVPSIIVDAPALFFWQAPLLYMCVELSWVDPLQVMLITLGVAAYVADKKTLAAIILGVAISSKQSMFWVYPLAAIVLRFDLRRWVIMGLAALVPVIPFVIWDFKAMKHANFDFMSGLPPRRDALCFTNALYQWFGIAFPTVSAFVLAAMTVAAACLAKNKTAFYFALSIVLTYFVFFFFNRWAFANYYFLLTGLSALMSALAVRPSPDAVAEKPVVATP